ncbi:DUF6292 family protein [Actinokineospora soli]|uniref:DUF6292 family protein n=1 Tax=Actinokineospora soli TaxID=1048753 RepID=A0ABW2TS77_9PSEU
MESDFDDTAARGLQGYLRLVTGQLRLSGECGFVDAERPMGAYLALDGRLPAYPDRDVALVWDEVRGWAVAVETHSGEDLLVCEYYGADLVPAPDAVARWVRGVLSGKGRGRRLVSPRGAREDVAGRLAPYAIVGLMLEPRSA